MATKPRARLWLWLIFFALLAAAAVYGFTWWNSGEGEWQESPYVAAGTVSAAAASYYVAPGGDDSGPGSEAEPWATIGKAAAFMGPGSTVYIRAGTYAEQVVAANAGAPGAAITYAAYPGEQPVIDGSSVTLPPDELTGLFVIEDVSYIKVSGLKIQHAGQNDDGGAADDNHGGIMIDNAAHITIEYNTVYDTVGSGISAWNSQEIIILGNEVELANNDGEQEMITVATTSNFEIRGNHVHHGGPGTNGGEGIDAKDGSHDGKITGNHIHHIGADRTCLYIDAWENHTYNIEVSGNTVHHCAAGITLASEAGGLLENIQVFNNVAYQNRAHGLEIGSWGTAGTFSHPVSKVSFINNTVVGNGTDWGAGFYTDNNDISGITLRNNIFSGNGDFAQMANESSQPITAEYNLIDGEQSDPTAFAGSHAVSGPPAFVDAAGADFHLTAGSAAVDSGTAAGAPALDFDGAARPQDGDRDGTPAFDLGAYEYSPASAIFYVAPDGDDNGAGTLADPWRTVQKAASTLGPGESAYIRQGVYNEAVTVNVSGSAAGGPVTLRAYPGETAVLDGTGLAVPEGANGLILIDGRSHLVIQDLEIRGYGSDIRDRVPSGIFVHGASHHIQLIGNRVHHIETRAVPAGADLLGADAHGIAVYGDAAAPITDLLISRNQVYSLKLGSSEAVVINGNVDTFTVTHNLIHDNDNIGLDFIGFEGVSPEPALDQARSGLVRGNHIYNIDSGANPSYGERSAGGIYVDGGADIIIEANIVHNANIGIEIASEHSGKATSRITVRSNFIYHNHLTGIAMGGYDDQRGSTEGCLLLNNTLFHNDTDGDGNGELLIQYYTADNVIKNNILVANVNNLLIGNLVPQSGNSFDSNIYYSADPEGAEWQWQGDTYAGFASFQSGSGVDAGSRFIDPLLADPALPDLHLSPDSPAVDAGQDLPQSGKIDIDGGPRKFGPAVDIGADEFAFHVFLPAVLRS